MTWRDDLQDASFRGAAFKVKSSSTGVGRRTEMHVYPSIYTGRGKKYQDYVWAKDLGSEPDSFSIDAYVIQNKDNDFNYFEERDALIKALKTAGPGTLVHPFFKDSMRVSVDGKATIDESITEEGGIAKFKIQFVQYNEPIFSQQEGDSVKLIDTSVFGAINGALDTVTDYMNAGLNSLQFLNSALSPLRDMMGRVHGIINGTQGLVFGVSSFANNLVYEVTAGLEELLSSPCDLVKSLRSGCESFLYTVGMSGEIVQGGVTGSCSGIVRGQVFTLDGTFIPEIMGVSLVENIIRQFDFEFSDLTSVTSAQENNKQLLIVGLQTIVIGSACRVAIRTEFSSKQVADRIIQKTLVALDNLLLRIGALSYQIDDPNLFQSVRIMRAQFALSMYEKFKGLSREIDYNVPSDIQTTLVLAYDRYEDITRADEIYSKNYTLTNHPGFLPNGEAVSILDE